MKRLALTAALLLPLSLLVPGLAGNPDKNDCKPTPTPTPVCTPTPKPTPKPTPTPKPKPPKKPKPPAPPPHVPPPVPKPLPSLPKAPPPSAPAPAPVPKATPAPGPVATPRPSPSLTPSGSPVPSSQTPPTVSQVAPVTFVPDLGSSTISGAYSLTDSLEARMNRLRSAPQPQPIAPQNDYGYSKDGKQIVVTEKRDLSWDDPDDRGNVWVNGTGDFGSNPGHSSWDVAQLALGVDWRFAPTWVSGLTGEVGRTWGHLPGGSFTAWDERLGLYTTYWHGGFWLQGAALAGIGQYEVHGNASHGTAQGYDLTGYGGIGYDFHPGVFTIGPFASYQFDRLHIDKGNGSSNVGRARAGLRATAHLGRLTPYTAVAYECFPQDRALRSGVIVPRDAVWVQAGASFQLTRSLSAFSDWSADLGDRYSNQQVNLGLNLSF